jgi:hypothetical protein
LCILAGLGKLPPGFPGPLICRSFTGTFTGPGAAPGTSRISAFVAVYGGAEGAREVSGAGENEAAAVSRALQSLCGLHLDFSPIALNGSGGGLRLYAEITVPSGRSYALERLGASAAELLFLCGLDAINAEAVRAAV